ncbi:hypothetical protein [Brevibacillus sp. SYSU BS000544]|uniref:hypothetical protein n=1 Tax=Brevibacillus sp. SYSU BS000544 TaxID=3416443 RepID=UPI003CE5B2BD
MSLILSLLLSYNLTTNAVPMSNGLIEYVQYSNELSAMQQEISMEFYDSGYKFYNEIITLDVNGKPSNESIGEMFTNLKPKNDSERYLWSLLQVLHMEKMFLDHDGETLSERASFEQTKFMLNQIFIGE